MVHYPSLSAANTGGRSASRELADFSQASSPLSGPLVAVSGDVEGNGTNDLVVGQGARGTAGSRDGLEVYRVQPAEAPQRVAQLNAFDGSGVSSSGALTIGDVVPSEPGEEIIVAADGAHRPAVEVRVFGGLARGTLHLLSRFPAVRPNDAQRQPLRVAVGDVLPEQPGAEIVVGDRRGRVAVFSIASGQAARRARFSAFPDLPMTSARQIAVGDLIPSTPGSEIVVADDGTRGDGLVRVFEGSTGRLLADFNAFPAGAARAGVELWVADVIASSPGAELIVGQGAAGGGLRVFSLARGIPRRVMDIRNSPPRATSSLQQIAIGALLPDLPGEQIAIAPVGRDLPVQVLALGGRHSHLVDSVVLPNGDQPVDCIAVGR